MQETNESQLTIVDGVVERCEKTVAGRVVIPEGVTRIGEEAFKDCIGLHRVRLPGTVTEIGSGAFEGCLSLQFVRFPDSVTKIGAGTFRGCMSLKSVRLPPGLKEIPEDMFHNCHFLGEVKIPSGVKKIGSSAFFNCCFLVVVDIPHGVEEIGEEAFAGCRSLSQVSIPDSVTEIADFAFGSCDIAELRHPCLQIRGGIACREKTVLYCVQERPTIVIPEGMTEIGEGAFGLRRFWDKTYQKETSRYTSTYECSDWEGEHRVNPDFDFLTKVVIAKSITRIRNWAFYLMSLRTVVFPGTRPAYENNSFNFMDGNLDDDTIEYLSSGEWSLMDSNCVADEATG